MIRIILFLLFILPFSSAAQEVASSKNMNIRSDYGYEILGEVNDQILLYRDKGFEQRLSVFDEDLEFVRERKLDLEDRKARVYGLAKKDTSFLAFYGYKKDGNEIIRVAEYNEYAELLDTMTIFEKTKTFFGGREYIHLLSDDKSKTLIYAIEKKNLLVPIVFDNVEKKIILEDEYKIENRNLRKDLVDIQLTNQGDVLMLLELNTSRFKKNSHVAEIIYVQGKTGAVSISQAALPGYAAQDLQMSLDNYRRKVTLAGFYNTKTSKESVGYFYGSKPVGNPTKIIDLTFTEFGQDFINEVYGTKSSKKSGLKDYRVERIIPRHDGGVILLGEMQREFSRRPAYEGGYSRSNDVYGGFRGWVDYFNEDMIAIAVHPDGREHWRKVMYKKQFSQDDGGIFASFFLFKTPSRLRLIYNDEIKSNNIVSEYVLGPQGKNKRQSIFSTEYQNLKLRLKDAIQISNQEILIPSERNNNLSIVKITYI